MKKFTLTVAFFGLLMLSLATTVGAASTMWSQTYGGADYESAESVTQTSDGGYAIAGSTNSFGAGQSDFWLVKVDSVGKMEWNRTYGGAGMDVAESVIQTIDGGYALAGRTATNAWFVKTDSGGNMLWNHTYKGTETSHAESVVQTSDGGYALAGDTNFTPGGASSHVWLIKTDSAGNIQWNKTLGGGQANSLVQTSDGGYALGGYVGSNLPNFLLVKTDSAGDIQWSKNIGGEGKDIAFSVVQASDGGYALAGWTYSFGGSGSNIWLVKTDVLGNVEWNKTYGVGSAWSMVRTSDGGYALAGTKLVKTDSAGNMEWDQTIGGTQDQAYSLIQSSDGGYVLAGVTSIDAGYSDLWLVKRDEYGVVPEFHSWTPLLIMLVAVLAVAVIYRRSLHKQNQSRA